MVEIQQEVIFYGISKKLIKNEAETSKELEELRK